MIKIIRFLKMLFGKYEIGHEYFVNVKDINIPEHIKKYKIKPSKWNHKLKYWLEIGEFESFILLHRDFTLIDGYSSYLIAKKYNLDVVPVYFVD